MFIPAEILTHETVSLVLLIVLVALALASRRLKPS